MYFDNLIPHLFFFCFWGYLSEELGVLEFYFLLDAFPDGAIGLRFGSSSIRTRQ